MTLPVRCRRTWCAFRRCRAAAARRGYTLVEVLVATVLTLVIIGAVATLVGSVTESIAESRVLIESSDRLRAAQFRLQADLKFFTCIPLPPVDPKDGRGYIEIVEGPGPYWITGRGIRPVNSESGNIPDTSVSDIDDWFALTVRSYGEPFVGRFATNNPPAAQSNVAEVIWFLRGTTLHRRVLLVLPSGDNRQKQPYPRVADFYNRFDVSAHQEGGPADPNAGYDNATSQIVANSLSDLTKRENRFGHFPLVYTPNPPQLHGFPHPALWGRPGTNISAGQLGLPTLRECSHPAWPMPLLRAGFPVTAPFGVEQNDWWITPYPWAGVDPDEGFMTDAANGTAFNGPRIADDVILTHVIGFDIQVWDPLAPVFETTKAAGERVTVTPGEGRLVTTGNNAGPDGEFRRLFSDWANGTPPFAAPGTNSVAPIALGAYVNLYWLRSYPAALQAFYLNYPASPANNPRNNGIAPGHFAGPGDPRSGLAASNAVNNATPATYCTGDAGVERDGIDQDGDGMIDEGTDGVDNFYPQGGSPYNHPPSASGITPVFTGGVDDATEMEAPPPYAHPLRSIRIRIRMFEPDSRHVREVSVEQDFIR